MGGPDSWIQNLSLGLGWKYLFASGNVCLRKVVVPLSFEALLLFDVHSQNSESVNKVNEKLCDDFI